VSGGGRLAAALDAARPSGRAARLGLWIALGVLAVVVDVPLCPFAALTRQPCPGCGLTRATLELLHGHLGAALAFHPLVVVITPLAALVALVNGAAYVRHGRWSAVEGMRGPWLNAATIVVGVAMVAVWIARFLGAFGGPVPVR
jgi:hypothetical protein